jgi:hypothetical protein
MKSLNYLLSFFLLGTTFQAFAKDSISLPDVRAPRELVEADSEFVEGTITRLNKKDVEQFLPWAQNAQNVLNKALIDISSMPVDEQVRYLEVVIKSVVRNSGSKNYQLFMRFSLNRGLLLVKELLNEASIKDPSILENALDIQIKSIRIALAFYESDLDYQKRVSQGHETVSLNYAKFGATFYTTMNSALLSVLDASAQYRLVYKIYEMLNWDLSRDANAVDNADQIVEIYNTLEMLNETPAASDSENIKNLRRLYLLESSSDGIKLTIGSRFRMPEVGERIYYEGSAGSVLAIYENGKVLVHAIYNYTVDPSKLARTQGCSYLSTKFCVDTNVYYEGTEGIVLGIFEDGRVLIKAIYTYAISPSELALTEGCSKKNSKVCVDSNVYYEGTKGKVLGVFEDGRVLIKAIYSYIVDPSELALL